jgi:hypothetical protein
MFHTWLADHARGTLDDELTVALADVVEAVAHQEKKGVVVLELTVETAGRGGRTVVIGGKVKVKLPEPAPEQSIFYVGEAGSLWRDDPFAERLDGMKVDPVTGEAIALPDTDETAPARLPDEE